MNKIITWLEIVYMSSKWPFKICLGNIVYHHGVKKTVTNGTNRPYWHLDGNLVHESEFVRPFFINAIPSFKYGYIFYMGYWFDIWSNKRMLEWKKYLK